MLYFVISCSVCAQKTGRKRRVLSTESAVQTKKLQTVRTASRQHTADVMEDSCVIVSDDDQPQPNSELQPGTTARRKTKNKSRLSEMDSGIVVGEVEDDSAVGQAVSGKVSPLGTKVKQALSVTHVKPSQPESSASSQNVQTCHVNSVTVSSQSSDEILPENSLDSSSSRVLLTSDSLPAVGQGKRNLIYEFDATEVTQLTDAKSQVEFLRKEPKQQQAEKKCARKDVDNQQKRAQRRIDNDSDIENDGAVADDDTDNDDQIVINSSDDEAASASNQMVPSVLHIDAGIVIIINICRSFSS